MTENILTIEEVAKYLRVSERTVYDWAQKGEIPAGKIGTVWRFKRESIERWVNERLSASKKRKKPQPIDVESVITQERIVFLDFPNKRDALEALADNLCTAPQITNHAELKDAILQREAIISTAIGFGIAIPHVRLASVSDLVVSVGISRVPITDFLPLDDEPVRILIMIAAAYTQHTEYLQTLSFFSAHLKSNKLRSALVSVKNTAEAYRLLTSPATSGFHSSPPVQ
ncbi:MAG: PTS sugar transporter subunit IIA [Spirochaetaceae bacterium]|jgi:PTS system nitrogen regulatory IIA component|nr:PTS sugar transporter subunit IIA [Spirochaetaceae bacterium]